MPEDDRPGPRRVRSRGGRAQSAWTPHVEGLEGRTLMTASQVAAQAAAPPVLTTSDVNTLLQRAAVATASDDAIIAVVDRGGNILGVRVEAGVAPEITGSTEKLVFAVDGAVAEARTGAFFGNDQAPLTSRTIQIISQSTMTQREVESDPNIPDPNSTERGPGFVAPVGAKGHFPPGIQFTPQVDLFQIEHTNRDSIVNPGPNHVRQTQATTLVPVGTVSNLPGDAVSAGRIVPVDTTPNDPTLTVGGDDVALPNRFNVPDQFIRLRDPSLSPNAFVNVNGQMLPNKLFISAPESYGFVSGLLPAAQSRGIGTLPGGIPLVKDGAVVGGIGVFFPGKTGFATEENSILNEAPFRDPGKPDRSLEAEYIAFVAAGGSKTAGLSFNTDKANAKFGLPAFPGTKNNKLFQGFDLPSGRIDLVGITLDIFGSHGRQGPKNLGQYGLGLFQQFGPGDPNGGVNLPVTPGAPAVPASSAQAGAGLGSGQPVPSGYLVIPHDAQDGSGLTAADVDSIIQRGVKEANRVRAAIRLPLDRTARMVLSVSDKSGNVLGLFRMPDATFFSIDVAVAKGRNVTYYADPNQLQPQDKLSNIPAGTAFTNRTFRYLAEPRFPEAIDINPPGPFSILNEANLSDQGGRAPASSFQTVQGFDSFNPQTNFHQPFNVNQNGIVFFPGSAPLYKVVNGEKVLVGGLGVSGDGVDQDDDVTFEASDGFSTGGTGVRRSDEVYFRGARLPYQKFNRQPHEPINQRNEQPFPEKAPGGVINILPRKPFRSRKPI